MNATASGYGYTNPSAGTYNLSTKYYYGGENETFTFQYTGDANNVWLIPLSFNPVVSIMTDNALTHSVIPYTDYKVKYLDNNYALKLELKRTAEKTYVLTLQAKGPYGGTGQESYLVNFPETDNYNSVFLYIYIPTDE